jgi:hypothetical protein
LPTIIVAIGPIETFISFDPAERRTPQTTKIISEYAEKGNCDAHFARGLGRVPLLKTMGVHALSVVVNGVAGSFILDSGAAWVSVTPEFSAKAKIRQIQRMHHTAILVVPHTNNSAFSLRR